MGSDNFTKALLLLDNMQEQKYKQIESYFLRNNGKEGFNAKYYEFLQKEYTNLLSIKESLSFIEENPIIHTICEHLQYAKELKRKGDPVQYIRLDLPLVNELTNLGYCYYVDLTMKGEHDAR